MALGGEIDILFISNSVEQKGYFQFWEVALVGMGDKQRKQDWDCFLLYVKVRVSFVRNIILCLPFKSTSSNASCLKTQNSSTQLTSVTHTCRYIHKILGWAFISSCCSEIKWIRGITGRQLLPVTGTCTCTRKRQYMYFSGTDQGSA